MFIYHQVRRELGHTGSSHTVCQIPELLVYQMLDGWREGWRRCLPTGICANSVGSKTLTASSCVPSTPPFAARASVMSNENLSYLNEAYKACL